MSSGVPSMRQRWIRQSSPTEATRLPSGAMATFTPCALRPSSVCSRLPVFTSNRSIGPSPAAMASTSPSGANAAVQTLPPMPVTRALNNSRPLATSQTCAVAQAIGRLGDRELGRGRCD